LPVSLFGMSVSAAELPTMAGVAASDSAHALRVRLDKGLRQIAFFVVPSAVAFLALGDVVAATVLHTRRFRPHDSAPLSAILAASGVGLLAPPVGRLYSSTDSALGDPRTPLRYAIIRVVLTTILGYLCAIPLPRSLGIDPFWGTAGLTASAGLAGWVEMLMLRSTLNARIGRTGLAASYVAQLWTSALAAAAVAWAVKLTVHTPTPMLTGAAVLGAYGIVFFGAAAALRVPELSTAIARIRR